MLVHLNIGLLIGTTDKNIGPATAVQAVIDTFTPEQIVTKTAWAASGELTLVVAMQTAIKPNDRTIGRLCLLLGQECIAGKINGAGFLIGPKAADWGGKFNYEYWLEPAELPSMATA